MNENRCSKCVFCGQCMVKGFCDDYYPATSDDEEILEEEIQKERYAEYQEDWRIYIHKD